MAVPTATAPGSELAQYGPVVSSAGVLASTVFVHECGHFFAALSRNIVVSRFSIGFGPVIASFYWRNVEVALRALPLGGYVGFPSDEESDPDTGRPANDPDLLQNRGPFDRALVLSAGVIANLIFAFSVLLCENLTTGHLAQQQLPGVSVPSVASDSSAEVAGIKPGDRLLAVNGNDLPSGRAGVRVVMNAVRENPERKVAIDVKHQSNEVVESVFIEPELDANGDGVAQMAVQPSINATREPVPPLTAVSLAASDTFNICYNVFIGLVSMLKSSQGQQMSSPVYIVKAGADMARDNGVSALIQFCATINCNLAVVNTLPLPALDGGYLAFVALEVVRGGKKIERELEQRIMASGLVMLASTSLFLIARDTFSLVNLPF